MQGERERKLRTHGTQTDTQRDTQRHTETHTHTHTSSIDMYNNDVGKRFMK